MGEGGRGGGEGEGGCVLRVRCVRVKRVGLLKLRESALHRRAPGSKVRQGRSTPASRSKVRGQPSSLGQGEGSTVLYQ